MTRSTMFGRVLNTALTPFAGSRKNPAEAWARTVAQVEEAAGRSDPEFAEGLGVPLMFLAEEPGLAPSGWLFAMNDARNRLANRLRVIRILSEHRQVAAEEIKDPVFVVGLPRTATTLAHKILAASPDHRGPLLWEMNHTDLLADDKTAAREQNKVRQGAVFTDLATPSLRHIHALEADQPEESMHLLPQGTYHILTKSAMPGYADWLTTYDPTPGYEYLRQALQVLQYGRDPKRWVLKYPGHLDDMDVIKAVFPTATFVWPHRDPSTAVGSLCSLMETTWSIYQAKPDPHEIGRIALERMVASVQRGLDSRLKLRPGAIVDVPYHRLSADPHAEVPRLYQQIGARWTARDAAALDGVLARPAGIRKHEYDLAYYGLDRAQVRAAFRRYLDLLGTFDELGSTPQADL